MYLVTQSNNIENKKNTAKIKKSQRNKQQGFLIRIFKISVE